ncbi:TolC family outer membrane protein [Erythrobacter litoralis]|uniref:Outer membrane protein TolC, putative n=1 Tax=Erythrobacter litoralis (strain HTCC2594) TaxID=314225 RepID=Q2N6L6_ERYLH|nr:TolC family outer membrane protein [Erythrobacter litoralis]ABC64675.1 outer membrane protein TolC, putative [Erythrobacter litoralis HTCC2594]
MKRLGRYPALLCGASLLAASPAQADTLREALVEAYQTNPTLQAARANQRAEDENPNIQRAQGLPSVTATAQYIEFLKTSPNSFTAPTRTLQVGPDLTVPLYAGGAVKNSVRAAKERVAAGQASLRGTESAIFSQVVAAYMDVLRAQALVGLNLNQVQVLTINLEATSDRFEIGDLTRTDVAQSQSRLALARGDLRNAEANLIQARESYAQLVGSGPDDLQPPPPLPNLPDDPIVAVETALESNPDLLAARERAQAAGFDTEVAGSGRLPTVGLFAGGDYTDYFGTLASGVTGVSQSETTANAGIRLTVPIFQGGLPAARQRQAAARETAALEQVIQAEREVIATTRAAFSSYEASLAVIESSQLAVQAAELSLEGVRAENSIGNRTILDVLNAEQELLQARAQLVTARRNAYVAGFTLLAAMGRAEARDLGLEGGVLYDPVTNYERVDGRIWDWDRDPTPAAQSTRTVDIPPANADVPGDVTASDDPQP